MLQQVDVLAMPTPPMNAHMDRSALGLQELITHGWTMLGQTAPVDLSGHPSISLPCATSNGLPVGRMLTGRLFDDATLLAVAHAFEQQVDWEQR